ncbi:Intraflagellar transport protein 46 like protein [Tritrichomonas foetus]|uniref:Intraflagellar transport protein 46 like protein n=1 Tax=Tritrichomonas foetus TaxID=1144522 RepID=A0A1J4L0Y1_9EUKA|nr:Intraflagellar transport protein 46 like protein [Tritrichomonas foetus]|eukprot:OHT17175.1 Intraflagellar transport protein 46 like protein [Tritrichomonas foetus]
MNLPISAANLIDSPDDPTIQPNSQYDQSISFSDSGSDGDKNQAFTGYSPRPDPSEPAPNFLEFNPVGTGSKNNDFNGFQFQNNDMDKFSGGQSPFDNGFGGGSNFSPRPGFSPNDGNQMFGMENKNSNFGNNNNFGGSNFGGGNNFGNDMGFTNFGNNNFGGGGIGNDPVAPELAPIFGLISQFQPPPLEISPHFKPFLPELVASIGAIDAFIKVPRPDGEQEHLGLTVLDEPTIGCANPQILKMQLREKFNVVTNDGDGYIGKIDNPGENSGKALQSFLESYDEISRNRAAPTMTYSYEMPDMEDLMQEWPEEMEKALASLPLPSADMDLTVEEYTKVICAMLEIPVKGNIVESLHVMFSLYNEFKHNQYFNAGSAVSTPMNKTRGNV